MKKGLLVVLLLAVIIVIGLIILFAVPAPTANAPTGSNATTTLPGKEGDTSAGIPDLISVGRPSKGETVTSPLIITGSARGTFYFEASFPIEIKDANGKVIAQGHAEAQSNWMTEDFVIFKASITYPPQPKGSKGTVVLKNDNPSGDPSRDKKVEIPVVF